MKLLLIPDIHQNHHTAQCVIDKEKGNYDRILFLGDFFDNWHDTPKDAELTAQWLKEEIFPRKNVTILTGNHDVSYRTFHATDQCVCSGFTREKHEAIHSVFSPSDWTRFKYFEIIDSVLYSHAGLHPSFLPFPVNDEETLECFLNKEIYRFHKWIQECIEHRGYPMSDIPKIFEAGSSRGGRQDYGGILWCDSGEFMSIGFIKQIFGHTFSDQPSFYMSGDLCIDTALKHYAIVKDGKIKIKKTFKKHFK